MDDMMRKLISEDNKIYDALQLIINYDTIFSASLENIAVDISDSTASELKAQVIEFQQIVENSARKTAAESMNVERNGDNLKDRYYQHLANMGSWIGRSKTIEWHKVEWKHGFGEKMLPDLQTQLSRMLQLEEYL